MLIEKGDNLMALNRLGYIFLTSTALQFCDDMFVVENYRV